MARSLIASAARCAVAAAIVPAGLLLAGCSNTQSSINRRPHTGSATASVVNGVQQVTVRTGDNYRFDPSTITVHPGRVEVILVNGGKGAPHNWSLLALSAATPLVPSGATESVTFTAPAPGTYTFVCTIHEKQGQTGKLVVLSS